MHYTHKTSGICAKAVDFDMDENQTVTNITYTLGCDGNGKALAAMCEGLCANDIIKKLSGITCGPRKSSCPDQLAKGLKEALAAAVKK